MPGDEDVEMKDAVEAKAEATGAEAMDESKEENEEAKGPIDEESKDEEPPKLVLPPVDGVLLEEMTAMGFSELTSRKALMAGSKNAEQAVQWCVDHENDATLADPIPLVPENRNALGSTAGPALVVKSYKCVETGRLFRTAAELQVYAERTSRTDFEETTEEKKPLTEDEKKAKIAELKARAAARRAEREGLEQVENVDREKERRKTGQKAVETKEQLEKAQRMREAQRVKYEKNAEKRERERLRAEIAKDKAERRARGGMLAGRLGVEGYAPSIDNNDARRDGLNGGPSSSSTDAAAAAPEEGKKKADLGIDVAQLAKGKVVARGASAPALPPAEVVDKAIGTLARYKAGGDGGVALKTLGAYVRNAVLRGAEDPKFLAIPAENPAFKKRVAAFVGGLALLKAIGFVKDETEGKLLLSKETRERNIALLQQTLTKLEQAHADYTAANGLA